MLLPLSLLLLAAPLPTRRLAIVASNNNSSTSATLHFAERDAEKFARTLTELAGVDTADLILVPHASHRELRAAFIDLLRER